MLPHRVHVFITSIALLAVAAVVVLATGTLTPTVHAKNGQQLSAQFGEAQGSVLGRCDPQHRFAEDPGPVDKKSTVTFDLNNLEEFTQVKTFAPPPSCVETGSMACQGQGCNAFHQVVILEEGISHDEFTETLPPPPVPGANLFIFQGSGAATTPAGWLDPAQDPLPDGVLAAGASREDYTYTFNKKGTYLVLCNVRSHYDLGMWIELEVTNINLDKQ